MTKTIPTTMGVLIIAFVAGIAGASVLLFSQEEEEVVLEEETLIEESEIVEEDEVELEKKETTDINKDKLKEEIRATEIISYELTDSGRIKSVEFWTEATCPFWDRDYEYETPEGFIYQSCKGGEIGSHGGCPTCEMSKISLTMAINNLEDYVESINIEELSLGERIKNRLIDEITETYLSEFYVDTGFKKNFINPYWEQTVHSPSDTSLRNDYNSTLEVLDYFFEEINIKNLVQGYYSKKDIQNIFEDQKGQITSGYSHDEDVFEFRNFEIATGNFDYSNDGAVAIISFARSARGFNYPSNYYILVINSEGERRLLLEMEGHKTRGWINITPINIGGNSFFEAKRSGYGGTCVGKTTIGTICRLKNMKFFCYDKPLYRFYLSMGPGCGSQENIRKKYEVKDINGDGENELVITFTAVYVIDIYRDETKEQTKKIMEETYKLDGNGDLVLLGQNIF